MTGGKNWTKSPERLRQMPEVEMLTRELGERRIVAAGLVGNLYQAASENWTDGDLSGVSARRLAAAIDWDGDPDVLIPALQAAEILDSDMHVVGWFDEDKPGSAIVRAAEVRKQNREHQAAVRQRKKEEEERPGRAPEQVVPEDPPPFSAVQAEPASSRHQVVSVPSTPVSGGGHRVSGRGQGVSSPSSSPSVSSRGTSSGKTSSSSSGSISGPPRVGIRDPESRTPPEFVLPAGTECGESPANNSDPMVDILAAMPYAGFDPDALRDAAAGWRRDHHGWDLEGLARDAVSWARKQGRPSTGVRNPIDVMEGFLRRELASEVPVGPPSGEATQRPSPKAMVSSEAELEAHKARQRAAEEELERRLGNRPAADDAA